MNAQKMGRLAALAGSTAAVLFAAAPAQAVVVLSTEQGWEISFDGSVNAFAVYQDGGNAPDNVNGGTISSDVDGDSLNSFRVRTGLLPAVFAFNVKSPVVGGLQGAGRIGFYPQIQNSNTKNQFGSQIDLREAFFTVNGNFGQFLAGRALSLFLGENILTDMTLYGVGVQGGVNSGGTTLGRIGYGYVYPNFNASLRYDTPDLSGFKFKIGAYDPSKIGSSSLRLGDQTGSIFATETKLPRMESELSFANTLSETSNYLFWLNGMWQKAEFTQGDVNNSVTQVSVEGDDVTAWGYGGGMQLTFGSLQFVLSGYNGQALGTTLQLDTDALDPIGHERKHWGYLAQGTWEVITDTTLGLSYGQSNAKESNFEKAIRTSGGAAELEEQSSWTFGVYHDVNKWWQVNAEYTRAKNDWFGGEDQDANIYSIGTFFLF